MVDEIAAIKVTCGRLEDLMRVLVQPILETALSHIFTTPQQWRAYELSDGFRSTREIGSLIGVDQKTVSSWWQKWATNHKIVEKVGKQGRCRKRYSWTDLVALYGSTTSKSTLHNEGV